MLGEELPVFHYGLSCAKGCFAAQGKHRKIKKHHKKCNRSAEQSLADSHADLRGRGSEQQATQSSA